MMICGTGESGCGWSLIQRRLIRGEHTAISGEVAEKHSQIAIASGEQETGWHRIQMQLPQA